ncbi:MAG: hypothetical protein H6559_34215 [Lewinellaceae bacterium]|nr:hypothetical protein [Lewinellaceae bacterium]
MYPIARQHPEQHDADGTQRHQDGGDDRREGTLHGKAQVEDDVVDEGKSISEVDQLDTAQGKIQEAGQQVELPGVEDGVAGRGEVVGVFSDDNAGVALLQGAGVVQVPSPSMRTLRFSSWRLRTN